MRGTKAFSVVTRDVSTSNITSSYTELIASTAADTAAICAAITTATQIIFGIGGAGSEEDFFALAVSTNQSPQIPILIPKGSRISVKSLSGSTISAGVLGITLFN